MKEHEIEYYLKKLFPDLKQQELSAWIESTTEFNDLFEKFECLDYKKQDALIYILTAIREG